MKFSEKDLAYWAFMSREEWQFCYALSFARQILELVPATGLNQSFRDVVIEAHRDGYQWTNLVATDDGDLHSKTDDPTSPENLFWLKMISDGTPPDFLTHLGVAIDYAEANDPLARHISVLRGGLNEVETRNERHKASFDALSGQEKDAVFGELFDAAMEDVTGKKRPGKGEIN